MGCVVRFIEGADGRSTPLDGLWLKSFDPDVGGGRGHVAGTPKREDALRFANKGEAWEFWRQVSRSVPLRPDGNPNRPLTAFTIEILDDGAASLFSPPP